MKGIEHCMFMLLAGMFYSVIFFGTVLNVQAGTDFKTYIWEFGTRDGTKSEITRNLTQEFETAFIHTRCCSVLERRSYDRLMSQKENEKALMSIDGIADSSVGTLKTLEADAVIFGEVYDDVRSGEVKTSVIAQDFEGRNLTAQSVRLSRGKLSDAASREESMKVLSEQVCSALIKAKVVKQAPKTGKPFNYSFASYRVGDIIPELGEHNMIVNTKNGPALTSASRSPAMITLQGFSYKNNIELHLNVEFNRSMAQEITLRDRNKEVISLKFGGENAHEWYTSLTFGDYKKQLGQAGWKLNRKINALKITIKDNLARFYLNDIFLGLQEVTFDSINKVTVTGIRREEDFIYSIAVTPMD